MYPTEQSSWGNNSTEQPVIDEQDIIWFHFPCNVIPFKYDEKKGWLYVHGLQLMESDQPEKDPMHLFNTHLIDMNMGALSIGYSKKKHNASHIEDQFICAPLHQFQTLNGYIPEFSNPNREEIIDSHKAYHLFTQMAHFDQLTTENQNYLMQKNRQFNAFLKKHTHGTPRAASSAFKQRLASGYYDHLQHNMLSVDDLISDADFQQQLMLDIQHTTLNCQMLTLYINTVDVQQAGFEHLYNAMMLTTDIKDDEKLKLLKTSGVTHADLDTIEHAIERIKQIEIKPTVQSSYTSLIPKKRLTALSRYRNRCHHDQDFNDFVIRLFKLMREFIEQHNNQPYKFINLLERQLAQHRLPNGININTLSALLYTLNPHAFFLFTDDIKDYIQGYNSDIDLKSIHFYIKMIDHLQGIIPSAPNDFAATHRLLAEANQKGYYIIDLERQSEHFSRYCR